MPARRWPWQTNVWLCVVLVCCHLVSRTGVVPTFAPTERMTTEGAQLLPPSALVWVAFRRTTQTGVTDWLRGTHQFQHAQIALAVPCERWPCSLCAARRRTKPSPGGHTLTFTADQENNVHRRVDQSYQPDKWELWLLPVTPDASSHARAFLEQQVGGTFHAEAMIFNASWAPFCACLPQCCLAWAARGVRRDLINPQRRWFCTELCVAALQVLGYCPRETPCAVSPDRLMKLLRAYPQARCIQTWRV